MKPAPFDYYQPETLDETLALLAEHGDGAKLLAGGQSLVPMMNFRLAQPAALIDLGRVDALAGVRGNGALEIGAMTRQSTALEAAAVAHHAPLLAEAMPWIGHVANRNRGTVGGSVAHADPAAELPAALLALDAEMVVRGSGGERVIPADDFFLFFLTTAIQPDELLTAVRVPTAPHPARRVSSFLEVARRHGDFALVGVCVAADLREDGAVGRARIGLFGVADRPLRVPDAEALLAGGSLADASLADAVVASVRDAIDPSGDHHGSAQYRKEVAGTLVARGLGIAGRRAQEGSM